MVKSHLDLRCPRAHGSNDDERRAEVILLSVLLPGGTRVLQAGPTTNFAVQRLHLQEQGDTNFLEKLLFFDGLMLRFQLTVCSVVHILLALEKSH